tara:strand:+ start:4131 stop:4646 length:516 start_codon:yes stop_codon:yes gene_type:complete
MEINNDLIKQWEPKIQKMLQGTSIIGMDRDDIAQELRIAIMRAANGFDEDKGVVFHTYLHTAMVNTIRTLITKAQKMLNLTSLEQELSFRDSENGNVGDALLIDESDTMMSDVELEGLFIANKLSYSEQSFVRLRLEGMTMEEITEDLEMSAYRVRESLRVKFIGLKDETA